MAKRVKRDKIELSDEDMLKPIDIEKFGSDKDPCFGKLYNLNTPECKRCGDSEICGAVFSRGPLKQKRNKIENKVRFKDIELTESRPEIQKHIKRLQDKGYKRSKIIRLTKKKFNIDRKEVLDNYEG